MDRTTARRNGVRGSDDRSGHTPATATATTAAADPGPVQNGALHTAAVQPARAVRAVRRQLRGGVPGQRRPRRHRADRRAVRPDHGRRRRGRRLRADRQAPGRPGRRAARATGPVRPGGGAARGRRARGPRRPAVLRRRGHAVDGRARRSRAPEHGPRPHRVLPDRVQRVRPAGGVRPRRVAQPLPGQPGHRLLAPVRVRHRQRVQVGPGGRGRLQHHHPRLGQRGRGPVRQVRAGPSGGRVPRRRPRPGARLPSGGVRPRAARDQGSHVRQHPFRDLRQRGPVRQHHLQEQRRSLPVRQQTC